jgi:hypothetical protein
MEGDLSSSLARYLPETKKKGILRYARAATVTRGISHVGRIGLGILILPFFLDNPRLVLLLRIEATTLLSAVGCRSFDGPNGASGSCIVCLGS